MSSPRPLRVLHIGKYFPPYAGGMETYLRDLMVAQTKQGIEPAALVHASDIGLKSADESQVKGGITLHLTRVAVWLRLFFTPISPTFPWHLNRLLKAHQPDVLHIHMPNVSAFWAIFSPRARRIPWVVQWQSDVLASRHSLGLRCFYALYRPFERKLLSLSAAVIASSPPYLQSSIPLAQFKAKCHINPLGLAPPEPAETPPSAGEKPNNSMLYVLAIGRLTYYKGFEYLVRAAAECDQIEVHIVGRGDQETRLKKLASELGAEARITFHGHLGEEALAEQFRRCDCLCLPSIERTESFGMVLLEAMYHRKPAIVSNVPGSGMSWVVDHNVTGLHCQPEDTNSLVNSLRFLVENRDKIAPLGENARSKFDRQFHIDVSARGVSDIYRQIHPSAS